MGDPFTDVTVSNYNLNPPPDDGSESSANEITWAKHKTKLADPLKTAIESLNTNIGGAVDKLIGGAGVTTVSANTTLSAANQGQLIVSDTASITITTPTAATVGSPFVFAFLNNSSGDNTIDGASSETIDGAATITVPPGRGLVLFTNGTNWFTTGQNYLLTQIVPQGYLTPTSATPIITSDVAGGTAVYYTPFVGNLVPVSDGTNFIVQEFSELTLTLNSNHVANGIYDVFLFNDSGTLRLGTGPVWNTVTAGSGARGTGSGTTELVRLKGLYVNKVSMTARNGASTYTVDASEGLYLGTILIDANAGEITCHVTAGTSRKWSISNAYNQQELELVVIDSTASWTPSGTRPIRNTSANSCRVLSGIPVSSGYNIVYKQNGRAGTNDGSATNTAEIRCGIGFDSTSATSGKEGVIALTVSNAPASHRPWFTESMEASYSAPPSIGSHTITALEKVVDAGDTPLFYGGAANTNLSVKWLG